MLPDARVGWCPCRTFRLRCAPQSSSCSSRSSPAARVRPCPRWDRSRPDPGHPRGRRPSPQAPPLPRRACRPSSRHPNCPRREPRSPRRQHGIHRQPRRHRARRSPWHRLLRHPRPRPLGQCSPRRLRRSSTGPAPSGSAGPASRTTPARATFPRRSLRRTVRRGSSMPRPPGTRRSTASTSTRRSARRRPQREPPRRPRGARGGDRTGVALLAGLPRVRADVPADDARAPSPRPEASPVGDALAGLRWRARGVPRLPRPRQRRPRHRLHRPFAGSGDADRADHAGGGPDARRAPAARLGASCWAAT